MARRKKEPVEDHRRTIAQAAHQLFSSKGLAATSVDMIAKAAGYSKATLYVYFKNKEEIFFSLVYKHNQTLHQTIKEIIDKRPKNQTDFQVSYLEICRVLQDLCQHYPLYFEGMIGPIKLDLDKEETPQVYKDIYQLGLETNQLISRFVQYGIELDYLQEGLNINHVTIFFWSALSGIIRMAENKKAYYELLGLDNQDFFNEEYLNLLLTFKKG